jgi:hypothetical protein
MANILLTSGRSQLQQLTRTSVGMPVALSHAAGLRRPAGRDGTMLRIDWRTPMLRVEFQDLGNAVTMRMEGRLVGPFAENTRDLVTRCKLPLRFVVNLSEVTFVDAVGEEMLSWLARIGGKFIADNCYPLHVCECLHLPMAPKRPGAFSGGDVARSRTF